MSTKLTPIRQTPVTIVRKPGQLIVPRKSPQKP